MQKKIAFLIPSMLGGGAEKIMATLVNELGENEGLEVPLITLEKGQDYSISDRVKRFILTEIKGNDSKLIKTLAFPYYFLKFLYITRKIKPDIVVAFLDRTILLNIILSKIMGYKAISALHIHPSQQFKNINRFSSAIFSPAFKLMLNKSYRVVAISESIKQDIIDNYGVQPDKIRLIYNPYDIKRIKELSAQEIPEKYRYFWQDSRVILNIGRYTNQKNQLELIEMFYDLGKKYPEIKLCILGKGKLENEIKELVSRLGLQNRVLLPEFQENPFAFMKNSFLFAFPSLWEGFPNSIVESLIVGLPVVSYNCESGPAEILLNNKYGLLVNMHDREGFKTAVELLLNDAEVYADYSQKSEARGSMFTTERFIQSFKELIDEA